MPNYFGSREVKEFSIPKAIDAVTQEEKELGEVLLTYKDGLPRYEAMPIAEWEAGKTEAPLEQKDRAAWFVKRTTALRTDIHKVFEKANPRFAEIGRILEWCHETYRLAFTKAVELKTGVSDFAMNGTWSDMMKIHEEENSKMVDEFSPVTKDILEVLRKHDIKIGDVLQGGFFQQLGKALEDFANKGFSLCIGSDDEHRRTNDLVDIFDMYGPKADGAEAGDKPETVENDQPSDKQDSGTLENSDGSSV